MKIDLHQVDAFTNVLFGGNPAGVVTNADGLSDEQMAHIAREMNLSETAFVLKPTTKNADVRLRYFTPQVEVDFCGHATVGSLYELARLKKYDLGGQGRRDIRIQTNIGVLDMWSQRKNDSITVNYTMPKPTMQPFRLQGAGLAKALGVPTEALLPNSTALVDTGLNDIFIPIASTKALSKLLFDFRHIRKEFAKEQFIVFGFFAPDTEAIAVRGVATFVGVDEDPFTGRLQSGLFAASRANGIIGKNQLALTTRQGKFIGRPGEANLTFDPKSEQTTVTALAKHVFSTELELTDETH